MLAIPSPVWEAIASHAVELYPEECCGALVGASDRVEHAVRLANTSENDRRRSYRIDPDEILSLTRQAQNHGTRILAIYHSHPDSEPRFSDQDVANACPWYRFLILSVRSGLVGAARCYKASEDSRVFEPVEFEIESAPSAE